ncbi:1-phosphofructokinase family hexose kinase [Rhizobium oryzicola]|uniref:Phosphofructokinase n=1 Tax=Rhizobium oryzicola TaxID=1232668 RepID=A0ABT8SUE9_9HYPH|nr:1-phosphofructokinase family hexose kinase [Rhizobium oryzicola]MDO1582077.1 1-phosphofructokinase family hexose kinase [Rhizobium oryzicola]
MAKILSITLNPTIDLYNDADRVVPTHKVRVRDQRQEVGGGGINVARVIAELGGEAHAAFLSGGATGALLEEALRSLGIHSRAFPIAGAVRVAFMVREEATGLEYRFVPEGPEVSWQEVEPLLQAVEQSGAPYVVASGSLPRGLPVDTYARIARITAQSGSRFVLDVSGEPLRAAVEAGGLFLMKPSLSELEKLIGHSLDRKQASEALEALVARGVAEHIALTLGEDGAILASADGVLAAPAISVPVRSTVGAGDSFVGALVWALTEGWLPADAFHLGQAAGAAAVMTTGTDICKRSDILQLYDREKAASGMVPRKFAAV